MKWLGGLICLTLAVAALAVIATANGWIRLSGSPVAVAAEQLISPGLANRAACHEFGSSDLRSPTEGLWFQRNCTGAASSLPASAAKCNRISLDPTELTLVAPGLYVFRQTPASRAYLWYSSSDTCFDLVSARVVTVICNDQTVSFSWSESACAAHGGVLTRVNGQ